MRASLGDTRISVLTPSRQRGIFLANVWRSLASQIVPPFEWIVGIDGDSDDSFVILCDLAKQSPFPIKVVLVDLHVGKSVIDNYIIGEASGDWLLWCDSDDALHPACIKSIIEGLGRLAEEEVESLYCIQANFSALQRDAELSEDFALDTIENLQVAGVIQQDAMMCVRATIMKAERFPEIDLYCPEGVVWQRHKHDMCLFLYSSLLIRRYLVDGITRSKVIRYPNSKLLVFSDLFRAKGETSRLRIVFYYGIQALRFGLHADVGMNSFVSLFLSSVSAHRALLSLAFPIALMLFIYDTIAMRIEKTHRVFNRNYARHTYKIYCL